MTTPYERTCSLILANDLLDYLLDSINSEVPEPARLLASHIRKHYPNNSELQAIADSAVRGAATSPLLEPSAFSKI
ncbi:BPSL0761 family protein [Herminiimonas glaciei]|uniref:BPSL0761 family protein n=1 Tax=Herminiimonas glaciei TaxID=523788 RepID=A0ABW2I616_9BURK